MRTHLHACELRPRVETNYEIRVRGGAGAEVAEHFPGLAVVRRHGETILVGPVRDQSELHAVLDRVAALGLELVEVRRRPAD